MARTSDARMSDDGDEELRLGFGLAFSDLYDRDGLAGVDAALTDAVFAQSTALGSLMRRKIEPITAPIRADLAALKCTS